MIAKVAIDSPLPQLDRLFDYEIPSDLVAIEPGVRVRVPFGAAKRLVDGFVVDLAQESDFEGSLNPIAEVVSSAKVLDSKIFQLARAVADRQAATLSDVLRLAVPDRSVAVEKKWLEAAKVLPHSKSVTQPSKLAALCAPVTTDLGPAWVEQLIDAIAVNHSQGFSSVVLVPDYRDHQAVLEQLADKDFASAVIDYSSQSVKSKKYANFLRCLSEEPLIVIGSRSAIYAPVRNLGLIAVWDDGDQSHQEPSSPYGHSREIALIRQGIEKCNLLFLSHSRSCEVERLVQINFLVDISKPFTLPKIANSDTDIRVDSLAWKTIKSSLSGGPVLVQVAAKGQSSSVYCTNCERRAECRSCNGPLWMDARNLVRCRWCDAVNLDYRCATCGNSKLRYAGAGSTRTVAEFGKAFPSTRIIEATGDDRIIKLEKGNFIVVATPGAEPRVEGGYAAVIILDANRAINRDSLKATEVAVRQWSNAIAFGAKNSTNVLVGVAGTLATKFSLWSQREIASIELMSRAELRFPPAIRLASVSSSKDLIHQITSNLTNSHFEVLGPIPIDIRGVTTEWRSLIKYEYSKGTQLAQELKSLALKLSSGQSRTNAKSGRSMRPITIKMDDVEVI